MPLLRSSDIVVVGGGIVGMATARALAMRLPNFRLTLIEKENHIAAHQTSHSSGVIHAGIYYKEGSLKARFCVEGMWKMYEYADKKKIPYKKVGKLIVATRPDELPTLENLFVRAQKNGVKGAVLIGPEKIRDIEPNCTNALKAIHSPHTGIINYPAVCEAYADDLLAAGGRIITNFEAARFASSGSSQYPIRIEDKSGSQAIESAYVVTCAGLQCDRVAYKASVLVPQRGFISSKNRSTHSNPNPTSSSKAEGGESLAEQLKIVPFRGDYLLLREDRRHLVRGNVYPVPDPRFPFLGMHFTPRMDGSVLVGPSAVLAFNREGYSRFSVNLQDSIAIANTTGLWRLAGRFIKPGLGELWRSFYIPGSVKLAQQLVPSVRMEDLRAGPCGIRAQPIATDGSLIDEFVFGKSGPRVAHVLSAPSPAATSSLSIAEHVVDTVLKQFELAR